VAIHYRLARQFRLSIASASLSVLLGVAPIIVVFLTALMEWDSDLLISLNFMVCLALLIASLLACNCDIRPALGALKLELKHVTLDLDWKRICCCIGVGRTSCLTVRCNRGARGSIFLDACVVSLSSERR